MITPKAKRKRCRNCRKLFVPPTSLQIVCDWKCAIAWEGAKDHARKVKRKENREKKIEFRTLGTWLSKYTQPVFNRYIRIRDFEKPCICCGRDNPPYYPRKGRWDAGHYRTRRAASELRFEEDNVHKECIHCNLHNTDHLIGYRQNLIERIGLDRVEWLEGPHEPKHYTIADCKDLIAEYRQKTKDLERITNVPP